MLSSLIDYSMFMIFNKKMKNTYLTHQSVNGVNKLKLYLKAYLLQVSISRLIIRISELFSTKWPGMWS